MTLSQPNIFTEPQEQWLGDAMADMAEREYKPVRNAEANSYLDVISNRLLAVLPPTELHFHLLLVESPEVNGFSLAGGRIYLTRKLVSSARSEDEVAGVIAHEMGHILTHQFAIETTADLNRLLHVTSVTDRADVYAKYQKLVDAKRLDKHPRKSADSDEKQDEADRVAVYTAAAAGYRPQAYAEFWDRVFFVGGQTGNRFSDFFGVTRPSQKRLRLILEMTAALPKTCGAATNEQSAAFDQWHTSVVGNQAVAPATASISGDGIALAPPLRMDLQRLRFSRDGSSILAQDESSIFVLSREPYQTLFHIDADGALPAEFSPDSSSITFHTPSLHTEMWSVKGQKLLAAHELSIKQTCMASKLAPDGRTLFCLSWNESGMGMDLHGYDVESSQQLFERKFWFRPSNLFAFILDLNHSLGGMTDMLGSSLSTDGNTLLIGPDTAKLAFDLRSRTPIKIGGGLRSVITGPYAFLGNDRIAGVHKEHTSESGTFSFPEGKQLQRMDLTFTNMDSTGGGDYVLVRNLKDFAIGAADLSTGKFLLASHVPALDVWQKQSVSENGDGSVLLGEIGKADPADLQKVNLPLSPLSHLQAAAISPDGNFLAISATTRGGVWNLSTGKREFLVRGFRNVCWTNNSVLQTEMIKSGQEKAFIAEYSLEPHGGKKLPYELGSDAHLEGGMLLEWKASGTSGSELVAHDAATYAAAWNRIFPDGRPGYAINDADQALIFSYALESIAGKALLKTDNSLTSAASEIKLKSAGLILEFVENRTGKVTQHLVVETPPGYRSFATLQRVSDLLYLSTGDNRITVYSASTGRQFRQIFGSIVSVDGTSGRVGVVNRRDEFTIYDAAGTELQHLHFNSPVRFAAFVNKANRAVLLTANQHIHRIDLAPVPSLASR